MYVLEWDNGHMIFDILFFFLSFFLSRLVVVVRIFTLPGTRGT